jgi:hypothetical protein
MKLIELVLIFLILLIIYKLFIKKELFDSLTPSNNITPSISLSASNIISNKITPSGSINRTKAMFKLNMDYSTNVNSYKLDYPNYEDDNVNLFIKKLISELSNLLNISNDNINIIQLHPGSIYVTFYISDSKLINILNDQLPSLSSNKKYIIINNIDVSYGVKLLNSMEIDSVISLLVPKINSIIDDLVDTKTPFALYANITNNSIPEIPSNTSNPPQKMYLTVSMSENNYLPCNGNNGMLKLSPNLMLGSVFNISKVERIFTKPKLPYKYIDFNNVKYDNVSQNTFLESIFYNVSLYTNNYSLSYCQQDCDIHNENGLCAQETYSDTNASTLIGSKTDKYNLKNLMKFKIENDNSVTPYFISLDPSEKIHFITNKYSTIDNPNDYTTIVQVPIYDDNLAYYNKPLYNTPPLPQEKYYTTQKVNINNLLGYYTQAQLDQYENSSSFSVTDTLAFDNDAYKSYAISFHIEKLSVDQIKLLSKSN